MVSLEQVKLLEAKVVKTIEYVKKISGENTLLREKLNSYQQRTDELEALLKLFEEDQSRIEDGILSALDRLNQFEDTLDNTLPEAADTIESNQVQQETIEIQQQDQTEEEGDKSQGQDNELDIF